VTPRLLPSAHARSPGFAPALLLALTMAAAPPAARLGAQAPSAAPASPTLVVMLTVDQLRPEYLERWRPQFTGGLKRLLEQGRIYPRGVHDHAITETAPGHASTLSGRFPYSTGIARNSAGVNTPDAPLVGGDGSGASPFRFQGTTLADWMVAADPRTRVLSVSRKDRGAILPIGRGRFPVFWYAPSNGHFVTSTWYADTLPEWVRVFNAEDHVMRRFAGRAWELLLSDAAYPEPDSVAVESGGQSFMFPHVLPDDTLRASSLVISFPFMDELTLDFAWRGVRAMGLGAGPQADLLAVSLSTTDAVGHRWGPDSREVHDQLLRLDRSLGAFLDSLIALRGEGRIAIALTSDHGVGPSPEIRTTWGDNRASGRVSGADFNAAFAAVAPLVSRSGIDPEAFEFTGRTLELDQAKAAGKEREVREIARTFAKEAAKVPGVLRVDVIDDLARADTVRDVYARRWLHMFRPGGDVLVAITLRPHYFLGRGNTGAHGSPHDYDARVPVILWGTPFSRGPSDVEARVVDIAPTLAAILGVTPLEPLDGRVLPDALRRTIP
jgi:predicted AlkP superfamily pyrophosphatase or phosphodiesterase